MAGGNKASVAYVVSNAVIVEMKSTINWAGFFEIEAITVLA